MTQTDHNKSIVDQFTRQAVPFSQRHAQDDLLQIMLRLSRVTADDTVLDVGCGPGIVACAFASIARHVTGLDLTPAMLDRALALQQERGLDNLTWQQGDVSSLPFPDHSFSVVVTRFTFHHLLSPLHVLSEMVRVCQPGGCVLVVDVSPDAQKLSAYDHFETLRDPSHVHALSPECLHDLVSRMPLVAPQIETYKLAFDLERQLAASFPNPGDADRIRQLFHDDLGRDDLGVGAHLKGKEIHFAYPVTAIAATKVA